MWKCRFAAFLSRVSSHDIAVYPDELKELDGVREVHIVKRAKDQPT